MTRQKHGKDQYALEAYGFFDLHFVLCYAKQLCQLLGCAGAAGEWPINLSKYLPLSCFIAAPCRPYSQAHVLLRVGAHGWDKGSLGEGRCSICCKGPHSVPLADG